MGDPSEAALGPKPRQILRVGFSLKSSELILGESADGVCFDAAGDFTADGKKSSCGMDAKFSRGPVIGVVLNLDKSSPNANTISLYKNGVCVAEAKKLPEALHGKTLYPHVAFRNITVRTSFGPEPLASMP